VIRVQKVILLMFIFLGMSEFALAQDSTRNAVYNKMKQEVERNILIYRIRNDFELNRIQNENMNLNRPYFMKLLPDQGFHLKLFFRPLDLEYPKAGFIVFEVLNKDYTFTNGQVDYEVKVLSDRVGSCLCTLNLVALNFETGEVLYLSGKLYKSLIANDFNLDFKNIETIRQYLAFRLFFLDSKGFNIVKDKRKYILFSGFSEVAQSDFIARINKDDPDDVKIEWK